MRPGPATRHPVEIESYRLLDQRVDLSHLAPAVRAVAADLVQGQLSDDVTAGLLRIDQIK